MKTQRTHLPSSVFFAALFFIVVGSGFYEALHAEGKRQGVGDAVYHPPEATESSTHYKTLTVKDGYYLLSVPYFNNSEAPIAICGFLDTDGNGSYAGAGEACLIRGLTSSPQIGRRVQLKWPIPVDAPQGGLSSQIVIISNDTPIEAALALISPRISSI